MAEINLSIRSMKYGLRLLEDEVNAPAGSFRMMRNALITDRDGISKRPGISVVGDYDSSGNPVVGLRRWQKADGTEHLLKAIGTYHKYLDTTWENLESSLTSSATAYGPFAVNTEADDWLYFTSKENGYKRWKGWYDRTTAALSGGETEIPVTSVLKADVFHSGTASSVSTTTINVSGTPWATNQWVGFYVRITSGAQEGKISLISAGTSSQITFTAIAGLSGTPTFEIRQLDIPVTGTVRLDDTEIAYTGVTNDDSLTVGSAHAAASGSPVVIVPTYYPANPKGSAMDVWLTKILVADIKSAMSLDSLGNAVATSAARALYISATGDGTDFTFSAPRSADEGDIISFAYGGGYVRDAIAQEDAIYAGTDNYIEKITYTQTVDATGSPTDLSQREPLKPGIGLVGKFVRGKDDIYFFTPQGEITSIGRVESLDSLPQSLDIGLSVRRLLDNRVNDEACGLEYRNRLHFAQKLDSESSHNDRMLVYNRGKKAFEGDWLLPALVMDIWDGYPVFGQANGANVMRMYDGTADIWDSVRYPIVTEVKSNWINITPTGMEDQAVMGIHVAGYIRGNSEFDFSLMADWSESESLKVNFQGSESDFTYSANVTGSLGTMPLGQEPLASIDEADADGYRRFRFTVWFPEIYCNVLSWGWKAYGVDEYVEITNVGFTVMADPMSVAPGLVKTQ